MSIVMTLQEISDRLEIQDLMVAYSHAVDTRDWDAFDDVFTPDATIDYTEMGGSRGTLEETKQFLRTVMPHFSSFQHMVATSKVTINGDSAEGRTICHNPMVMDTGKGEPHVFFCGLWYRDHFVRTPAGWRIKDRYEEKSYTYNQPTDFKVPVD
jgi:3-phenylpropionate/cinnamic acid dioxygenase small subunit